MEEKVQPQVGVSRLKQSLWLVGLVVAFFAVQLLGELIAGRLKLGVLASASVTQAGIMLVAILWALIDGGGFKSLGVFARWKSYDAAVVAAVLFLHIAGSLFTMIILLLAGLYDPESSKGAIDTFSGFGNLETGPLTATALLLALQAGIGEEILFRGYIITRLERLGFKAWACILLSAVIFGLVHVPGYGWAASLPKALWLGIPTAIYFWYRRNLGPLMVAHSVLDFAMFMLLGLLVRMTGGHLPTTWP